MTAGTGSTLAGKPLIALEDVDFSYAPVVGGKVLEGVSLSIERGDFACIVGPNGGGKTTLLKLILGELAPQRGSVRVFGRAPAEVGHRLGYLRQDPGFDPSYPVTVMDVVLMGRQGKGFGPSFYSRHDRDAARAALAEAGLEGREGESFARLSGGQRQRTLIARVLITEPELLLLDEPTTYLDMQAEQELYELLGRLNERLSLVIVSHDLFIVSAFVNKVVCVKGTVHVHPTEEVSDEMVGELYGGDVRMVRHSGHSHGLRGEDGE